MIAKAIFRTIFYQWFILFVGIAIGFICNAQWVGHKYLLVEKSIDHIFYPIEYTPEVKRIIKDFGAYKIWANLGRPDDFKILDDFLYDYEVYKAQVSYKDKNGKVIKDFAKTWVRWKPWEYYYEFHEAK